MSFPKNVEKQAYVSDRVVLPDEDGGLQPAIIIVSDGKIQDIIRSVDEETICNLRNVKKTRFFVIFNIDADNLKMMFDCTGKYKSRNIRLSSDNAWYSRFPRSHKRAWSHRLGRF